MDWLRSHTNKKSMPYTRLLSGSPFSPLINRTQQDTHPHFDMASAPYHLHQLQSQAIESMITVSYLQQLHSLRQYQACLASAKNISVRAEWHGQSTHAPSEPSESPCWQITPAPASMPHMSRCLLPCDRCFAVSSHSVGLLL